MREAKGSRSAALGLMCRPLGSGGRVREHAVAASAGWAHLEGGTNEDGTRHATNWSSGPMIKSISEDHTSCATPHLATATLCLWPAHASQHGMHH